MKDTAIRRTILVTLIGSILLVFLRSQIHDVWGLDLTSTSTMGQFSWEKLPPLKTLEWHDCYIGRQCARLVVPLDHSKPEGREAAIALMRIPSSFAEDSESYRGPILFNPGGPGAGGIDQIQMRGDLFRTIIGPQFDIVGFDPRGLGRSTPRVSFFKTNAERALWNAGSGAVNRTDEGLARTRARALVLGQLAAQNDDGSLRYMNTEQTARDMLSIVEAHGRSKLQCWGFSYGTVLGATFAAMFPDKIERLLLDGVSDADNHYGNKWSNMLEDTEKVSNLFLSKCAEAGQERCAFWSPTAEEIGQKLDTLFDSLRSHPVPVYSESMHGLVDRDTLRMVMFKLLKGPYTSFQPLAKGLADLAAGDGRWVLQRFEQLVRPTFECSCGSSEHLYDIVDDAGTAIMCNDYVQVSDDPRWAEDYYALMMNGSQWGDIWSRYLMSCQNWPTFPKSNFRGPFEANTSHPILFLSNRLDPVTPLFGAHKMSGGFPGSIVLVQEAVGHLSTVSPSPCTHEYIQKYFIDGTLPEPGTVCYVNRTFFPDTSSGFEEVRDQHRLVLDIP